MSGKIRDERIDTLKALSILSVPLAHYACVFLNPPGTTATVAQVIVGVLSHFMLPVFLFFSGWFHRDAPWSGFLAKSARAILVPYFVTVAAAALLLLAFGHPDHAWYKLLGILTANGSEVGDKALRWKAWAGPVWFLPMLFWCRVIHKAFYNRLPGYLALSMTVPWLAFVAGHRIPNYTFGLLTAFCCIGFYSLGAWCRANRLFERLSAFYASGLWAPALLVCGYSMCHYISDHSTFRFEPYPVIFAASLLSIVFLYRIAAYTPRRLMPLLNWAGQNTLQILCYHTLALLMTNELYVRLPAEYQNLYAISALNAVLTFGFAFAHAKVKLRFLHVA